MKIDLLPVVLRRLLQFATLQLSYAQTFEDSFMIPSRLSPRRTRFKFLLKPPDAKKFRTTRREFFCKS